MHTEYNEHTEISESGLTDKQERFAHEYLIDQNASAAALRAGYSAHSHKAQGAQLMAHPQVRARVKELLEELYALIKVNALTLMQERLSIAFFDPRRLVDAGSRPRPVAEWDDESAAVMQVNFDVRADGEAVLRARQPSRGAALSALERRFANFMRLQEETTITARERDDLHLSLGRDPASVKPGEVIRLTPDWVRQRGAAQGSQAAPLGAVGGVGAEVGLVGGVVKMAEAGPVAGAMAVAGAVTAAEGAEVAEVEPGAGMVEVAGSVAGRAAPVARVAAGRAGPVAGRVERVGGAAAVAEAAPAAAAMAVAPASVPRPAPEPAQSLTQRALAALRAPLSGGTHGGITFRPAPPPKLKEDKYWCDLAGNINVDHPHCPPEVRARELEKRRGRALRQGGG